MQIYFDYKDYHVSRPVITLGAFDGVHLGHLEILKKICSTAIEKDGESVVVTFWPHPRMVINHNYPIKLLNTLEEKIALIGKTGIQHLMVLPFTDDFSNLSSLEFVEKILVEKLNVYHLIVGYNHHFGKNREGNYDRISEYALTYGFTAEKLDAQYVENEKVSSTLIRNALQSGLVELANKYLGYTFSITGFVISGAKLGRTLGFPTANIKVNNDFKLIPHNGVYAVEAMVNNKLLKGMMNIGFRPTVNSEPKLTLEVHLFNFNDDIYDQEITVYFKQWVRNEIRFRNLDQLIQQLSVDKTTVMKILGT